MVSLFQWFKGWTHWNYCLFFLPETKFLRVKKGNETQLYTGINISPSPDSSNLLNQHCLGHHNPSWQRSYFICDLKISSFLRKTTKTLQFSLHLIYCHKTKAECQALLGPLPRVSRGFKPWHCGFVTQIMAIVVADQRVWSDLKFLNKLLMDCKSHSFSPQDTAWGLGPSSYGLFLL